MRLWHYELLPYLPKSQLTAQWRELNSIYKNHPNHILINYAYNSKLILFHYSKQVIAEMEKRGYKIKSMENFNNYFGKDFIETHETKDYCLTFPEHDAQYLTICYYNLKEKYLRGQKDFTTRMCIDLDWFYRERTGMWFI